MSFLPRALIAGLTLLLSLPAGAQKPLPNALGWLTPKGSSTATDTVRYAQAVRWLLKQQEDNGGFGEVPGRVKGQLGITAVAISALAKVPKDLRQVVAPQLEKAVTFLLSCQQKDGSFAQGRGLKTYYTAVSVSALADADRKKHAKAIQRGIAWLEKAQFGAHGKTKKSDVRFGGFGYDTAARSGGGRRRRGCDLSNTRMALGALEAAGVSAKSPSLVRARNFLFRCQNAKSVNDGAGFRPGDDGGFVYNPIPGESPDRPAPPSYAGMTYSGLHCLAISGLGSKHAATKAGMKWIAKNYDLTQNCGISDGEGGHGPQAGLFYFYKVFSEYLALRGKPTLATAKGDRRWAADLNAALAKRQREDGSFANEDRTWWENNPVLATSFAIQALNAARPFLSEK